MGDVAETKVPAKGFAAGVRGVIVSVDDRMETVTLAIDCDGQPPVLVHFERQMMRQISA